MFSFEICPQSVQSKKEWQKQAIMLEKMGGMKKFGWGYEQMDAFEKSLAASEELSVHPASNIVILSVGVYLRERKMYIYKNASAEILISALITIA